MLIEKETFFKGLIDLNEPDYISPLCQDMRVDEPFPSLMSPPRKAGAKITALREDKVVRLTSAKCNDNEATTQQEFKQRLPNGPSQKTVKPNEREVEELRKLKTVRRVSHLLQPEPLRKPELQKRRLETWNKVEDLKGHGSLKKTGPKKCSGVLQKHAVAVKAELSQKIEPERKTLPLKTSDAAVNRVEPWKRTDETKQTLPTKVPQLERKPEPLKRSEQAGKPPLFRKATEPMKKTVPLKRPEVAKKPEPWKISEPVKRVETVMKGALYKKDQLLSQPEKLKKVEPTKKPEMPQKRQHLTTKNPEPVKKIEPVKKLGLHGKAPPLPKPEQLKKSETVKKPVLYGRVQPLTRPGKLKQTEIAKKPMQQEKVQPLTKPEPVKKPQALKQTHPLKTPELKRADPNKGTESVRKSEAQKKVGVKKPEPWKQTEPIKRPEPLKRSTPLKLKLSTPLKQKEAAKCSAIVPSLLATEPIPETSSDGDLYMSFVSSDAWKEKEIVMLERAAQVGLKKQTVPAKTSIEKAMAIATRPPLTVDVNVMKMYPFLTMAAMARPAFQKLRLKETVRVKKGGKKMGAVQTSVSETKQQIPPVSPLKTLIDGLNLGQRDSLGGNMSILSDKNVNILSTPAKPELSPMRKTANERNPQAASKTVKKMSPSPTNSFAKFGILDKGFMEDEEVDPLFLQKLIEAETDGLEVLQKKSGRVRNSLTEEDAEIDSKSSYWSPVQKTVQLGPFDCTKKFAAIE